MGEWKAMDEHFWWVVKGDLEVFSGQRPKVVDVETVASLETMYTKPTLLEL